MACVVSTDSPAQPFDLDSAWQVHPQVSMRAERFGALLYHFGTRRLSFLKSPTLLNVLHSLGDQPSARAACLAAGVPAEDLASYRHALGVLATSRMICARAAQ